MINKERGFSEANNVAHIQREEKIRINWVGKRKH